EGIELVVDQVKDADTAETDGRHATEQAKKQAEIYHLDLDHPSKVLSMQEDDSEVQEVVEVVTTAKLITEVVTAATSQVSAASTTISAAKPKEELSFKTPAETPKLKDKGKGILIETPKPMKKKDQIELDAEYARKLHEEINKDHEEINKDIDWDAVIDHVRCKYEVSVQVKRGNRGRRSRGQTETGKEYSNPFMAGVNTPRSDDDRLKLMELMVFLLQKGKKIVISEDVIREILQLDDVEGVVCLPNEEIFVGLAQMGYEKPSTKLTFYKAFFSSQRKFFIHTLLQSLSAKKTSWNEFARLKFYMYPRFIQLIIQTQIGDLSTHTTRYISPALTQKVFANMKRVEKGFSGVETPLFKGMLAARQLAEEGIAEEQVQADDAVTAAVQETVADDGAEFPAHLFQQVLDTCSALTRHIENLEHDKAAQKLEIIKLKARVKRLERANKVKSSKLRRLKKAKKQAEIYHLDLDHPSKVLSMQEDDSEVQEVVEVVTTAMLITEVVIAATSQVSAARMSYDEIRPIFQARFDANMRFLFKSREEIEEEDQEHLEVVNDEDDDVFTEAAPLARKVPIVDYQIVLINNRPRFKIIKADETHQLYISFITLLKNFDREDMEDLWRIVKERFSTSKPTNFSDEYILTTLKTMFEKPDGQDAIWKSQRSVHGLALLILLVERRYPLSKFTLEQLVNVTRLQVEEESEMSLELLRFIRQQLQEYQQG
nr:hypothetical protein [Tanacetum cinerariifolium]